MHFIKLASLSSKFVGKDRREGEKERRREGGRKEKCKERREEGRNQIENNASSH